jgi:phage terminase large subunit
VSHYAPRSYQREFLQTFAPLLHDWRTAPVKRGILVWHRRAGKDLTALNFCEESMKRRSGVYYHFLPTYTQAKKIVWDGKDKEGRPFLANFDPQLMAGDPHQTELKITYRPTPLAPSGSIYQLIGGDQIDTIVGTNPVGVIFSEFPLTNPKAWDLVRPILRENGGWALFIFTPRGKNHAFDLWDGVKDDPEWFRSLKTIRDTRRDAAGEDGGPIMTDADVAAEIRAGMSRELANQEFYCSFEGAIEGAYYADQMTAAEEEGRIDVAKWIPSLPVDTSWDIGLDDETAIWFTQTVSQTDHRAIEYIEGSNVSLELWIKELLKRPYNYGDHYWPHDGAVRNWETGNTRWQFAATKGLYVAVQPKLAVEDGIEAARRLIPITRFDKNNCALGIDALRSYHRDKDDKLGTFKKQPAHDWSSHGADGWRTRSVAWRSSLGGASSPVTDRNGWKSAATREPAVDMSWKRDGQHRPTIESEPNVDIEWGENWWGKQ